MSQAGDEALFDRMVHGAGHDGDFACSLPCGPHTGWVSAFVTPRPAPAGRSGGSNSRSTSACTGFSSPARGGRSRQVSQAARSVSVRNSRSGRAAPVGASSFRLTRATGIRWVTAGTMSWL